MKSAGVETMMSEEVLGNFFVLISKLDSVDAARGIPGLFIL